MFLRIKLICQTVQKLSTHWRVAPGKGTDTHVCKNGGTWRTSLTAHFECVPKVTDMNDDLKANSNILFEKSRSSQAPWEAEFQ